MKGISNHGGCKCKQHEFILKPLVKDVHFSRKVTVSLCQCEKIRQKKKMFKIRKQSALAYPVFNGDGNFATQAFILPSEKEHFQQNRQIYLKDHVRKIKQYGQNSQNLYFPAPRSSHDYCNVCCCSYGDYLEHIASESHHKQIKRAKFNSYILEIEQMFKQEQQKTGSLKRIAASQCIEIDSDSSSGIFGYKKVKTDSRTELPSQNNYQFFIGENLIKEYQNYCQINNILLLQQQKQEMMENQIKKNEIKKFNLIFEDQYKNRYLQCNNSYYNLQPHQIYGSPFIMIGYQNPLCMNQNYYWQNMCYMMIQNNLYHQHFQQQQIELQLQNQQLNYYPSYFQSISVIQ